MNKDDAKKQGKLTKLKKSVLILKKQLNQLNGDEFEILKFLYDVKKIYIEEGATENESDWLIAYVTGMEKI